MTHDKYLLKKGDQDTQAAGGIYCQWTPSKRPQLKTVRVVGSNFPSDNDQKLG